MKARLALLLGLSAACSLEPKYTRPRAPVPEHLPQGEAYSNPTAKTGSDAAASGDKAALSWRALFLHPSLRHYVTVALGHNRDLRAALADMRAARAQHAFARAQVWPNIGVTAAADLGTMRQGRPLHDYSLLVGAEAFEIDVFGRLRSLSNRARELYFSS
ncbi:MAG TPA: hypothetical protein VMF89_32030, partial [Polyangiales bacterium]|nr:hypothetical protein [Polyangiales bacterium]